MKIGLIFGAIFTIVSYLVLNHMIEGVMAAAGN